MKCVRMKRVSVALVLLVQAFDSASVRGQAPTQSTTIVPFTTDLTTPPTTHLPRTTTPYPDTTTTPPNMTTATPSTTTNRPSTTPNTTTTTTYPPTTTPTTTVFPPTPTPTPCPPNKCHFDVLSFMGGIILIVGIEAIVFILWIFCKHGGKRSYNRL